MKRRGEEISSKAIADLIPTLSPTCTRKGVIVAKTAAELRCEAKRKLTFKRAAQLAPRYSLYALRHSWATNALQKGIDALTVAILMGMKTRRRWQRSISICRSILSICWNKPGGRQANLDEVVGSLADRSGPAGVPWENSPLFRDYVAVPRWDQLRGGTS